MQTPTIAPVLGAPDCAQAFQNCSEPLLFLREIQRGRLVEHAGKTLRVDDAGRLAKASDYNAGGIATVAEYSASTAMQFFSTIHAFAEKRAFYWLRGRLTPAGREIHDAIGQVRRIKNAKTDKRLQFGTNTADPACFEEFPRCGHMIDVDSAVRPELERAGIDVFRDAAGAAAFVADKFLPAWVRSGPMLWNLSSTSGTKGRSDARFHYFFWTDQPIDAPDLKAILEDHNRAHSHIVNGQGKPALLDTSVLHAVQPHYLAAPLIRDIAGAVVDDPLPSRWGMLHSAQPHSVLPIVDTGPREQKTTANKRVRTSDGSLQTLRELRQVANMPTSSAGCEGRIGDGPGRSGFHVPTRQAIFWRLVELLRGGSAEPLQEIEPYLASLQSRVDAAPRQRTAQDIADRRDIEELRRMAREGLGRAKERVELEQARDARRIAPLYADGEIPVEDAQADLDSYLDVFFAETRNWHEDQAHNRAAAALAAARLPFRIKIRRVVPPVFIAAHETGLAKSSGVQRRLASLNLKDDRVLYFAPNHRACEQVRSDLAKLGVETLVLRGIDHEDEAGPICIAGPDLQALTDRAHTAGASQRETACAICPHARGCAYLAQADAMRRPGIKILPHSFLASTIPGLSGKEAAPILATVIDERFVGSLKVSYAASWAERETGRTQADKWGREFFSRLAESKLSTWGTDDVSLRKLAERAEMAFDEYNDSRKTARCALNAELGASGAAATFELAELGRRQHALFLSKFCRLVKDQLSLGFGQLRGITAEWRHDRAGDRRLHASISYRDLLPDFGAPLIVLDATHDDSLTDSIFATRRIIDYGDGYLLAEPTHAYERPTYRRARAQKPFESVVAVIGAPTSKTALRASELKPEAFERAPRKRVMAGAAVVQRKDGRVDVYPPRRRRDDALERVSRGLRWFSEGTDGQVGIFAPKEVREYMAGHSMYGPNVLPGHHGVGTALNDWQAAARFAVAGVPRLDEAALAAEATSFFALDPDARPLDMSAQAMEVGIRLRDGSGFPVRQFIYSDRRVDALVRQIGEAQLEQELGRTRSVRRQAGSPVLVLLLADAVLDRTVDAVVPWTQLEDLRATDVAAAAGIVPEKARDLDRLLPGLFSSPRAAKDEVLDCAKNDARGYSIDSYLGGGVVFGAPALAPVAGMLPAALCPPKLTKANLVLRRKGRKRDRVAILADPSRPTALARYSVALGKQLVSAAADPVPPGIWAPGVGFIRVNTAGVPALGEPPADAQLVSPPGFFESRPRTAAEEAEHRMHCRVMEAQLRGAPGCYLATRRELESADRMLAGLAAVAPLPAYASALA